MRDWRDQNPAPVKGAWYDGSTMAVSRAVCVSCGGPLEPGDRFCAACGTPVAQSCTSCGTAFRAGARFCAVCGTAVAADPALTGTPVRRPVVAATAPPEERRLVTALFCDLVGFTPLAESLDPEDVRDIQAAYFRAMSEQIARYGGIVEKYAGDAVLALFGVPLAHEDDAERAVLCALGMQAAIDPVAEGVRHRWQVEVQLRVGVTTGEVVSGNWDASGQQQAAVTGDVVNTAARLQAAAEPGAVVVGEETMRLTRRRIRYGPRRELTLQGKAGAVPAYAAEGMRADVGERWEGAPRVSPLIGRDRELSQLLDGWRRAESGEGQVLTLIGEPGVGKSRLVAEAVERMAFSPSHRLLHARCLSYGQEISLWLIADLLRSLFSLKEQDGPEEMRAQLDATLLALLGADESSRADASDVLGEVLGLPAGGSFVAQAGPQIRRRVLIRSLRRLLSGLAERCPSIIVLEDLHWIDEASQAVLQEVLADVPGLRLLVLVTQRPDWNAPWREWSGTEELILRPLWEGDAALLAGAVLGGHPEGHPEGTRLSRELEQYVAERAGGNPFFVEELLRALEETGGLVEQAGRMHLAPGAAEQVPSTLTGILLARLDRLESQVKGVAQVGSVIGRSFAVGLLARVMEREQSALELPLVALQRAEIALPRRGSDLEYVFKHVTMREVAYHMLVSKRRKQLHLATARAIAALYPAEEYVELIAYHYGKTEEHGEAVGWLERAGDRAAGVYATESAEIHYRETVRRRELLGAEPLEIARVEEKLGTALVTAGRYEQALAVLERAVGRYREQRDLEGAGRATAWLVRTHTYLGRQEEGLALVQPMIEELGARPLSVGPSPALADLQIALSNCLMRLGRYGEMRVAAERAGQIARAIGDERLLVYAEERRAAALSDLGQPGEALAIVKTIIPGIEAGGDLRLLQVTLGNAAYTCERLGRIDESRRYMEQSLAIIERIGNPDQTSFTLSNLASVLINLGEWDAAEAQLERGMALVGEARTPVAGTVLRHRGQLLLCEGRWQEAERMLGEALAIAEQNRNRRQWEEVQSYLAELAVLTGRAEEAIDRLAGLITSEDLSLLVFPPLGWAYLEAGDLTRAEAVTTAAVERARAGEERFCLLAALRVQGMVLTRQDRYEEAEAAFLEGLELARSLPYPYEEGRIFHQMGLLEEQRGQEEAARRHLEVAQAIFRRLGATKDVERLTWEGRAPQYRG